jgi:RNA polymerase sigma-70 factor (ECF subfamily)
MPFGKVEKLQVLKDLYDKHYREICYFAASILKDRAVAEDVAMDTFLSLLKQADRLDTEVATKSLLYRIARNKCIDYIRKEQAKNNYARQIQFDNVHELPYVNEMIIAGVLQSIYEEIEQLPEQRKNIFKAIFLEGKSTMSIATELDISRQTVLNQKSAAIQTIKRKLSEAGIKELSIQ